MAKVDSAEDGSVRDALLETGPLVASVIVRYIDRYELRWASRSTFPRISDPMHFLCLYTSPQEPWMVTRPPASSSI